jgi:hypothetical protein
MTEAVGELVPAGHNVDPITNAVAGPTRDGRGRYERGQDGAEMAARCLELRSRSYSYRRIAAELGIDVASAYRAVQRGLRDIVEEAAEEVRKLELDKLDRLEEEALDILAARHPVVSHGRVLADVEDDGPKLAAIQVLLRVTESRRKLLGLDQPAKLSVDGGVRYEVVGVNPEALT